MGCTPSKIDNGEAQSQAIEASLRRDKEKLAKEVKLLLLGAGESGKSTVLKQMRLMNLAGWSDVDRAELKEVIFDNTIRSMQVVLSAFQSLNIPTNPDLSHYAHKLLDVDQDTSTIDENGDLKTELAEAVSKLWEWEGTRKAVERSHEYQLNDSASYYFTSIDRIASQGYVPTDQDILRSRVKTTGITEVTFQVKDLTYRCFDVGGQRSERRKWVQVFEGIDVLLFIIAISEYNQTLYEDNETSRVVEATHLWASIANSKWFTKSAMVLFLNKIDLFRAKLIQYPLSDYMDYSGPNTYEHTTRYLSQMFAGLKQSGSVHTHLTCATDTQQISYVLAAVNDQILTNNLARLGFI